LRNILIAIAVYLFAPGIIHAALRPFAISCHSTAFHSRRGWFDYDVCNFGLPQPAEMVISMIASGSHVMAFIGLFLVGFSLFAILVIWKNIGTVISGEESLAWFAGELFGTAALIAILIALMIALA
jgi:hypothetical protein